ncbi:hypothetical protein ABZ746_05615 [Streptomyces sp. NPDC020096]
MTESMSPCADADVSYYRPDSELPGGGRHVAYSAVQLAAALSHLVPGADPLAVLPEEWPEPRRRRILLAALREVTTLAVRQWTAAELDAYVAVQLGAYRESVEFDGPAMPVPVCEVCGRDDRIGPVRPRWNPEEVVFLCKACSPWAGTASSR